MAASKSMRDLLDRFRAKGFTVKDDGDGYRITNLAGEEFEMGLTGSSLNRIRRVVLEDAVNGNGASDGRQNFVVFGDDMGGRRGLNVLSDLAKLGLDIREHPKKAKREAKAAAAAAAEQETVSKQEPTPEENPMKTAVDEILANLPDVAELLHSEVLQRARQESCPVQWQTGKKYLDWTGDVLDILKEVWKDLDKYNVAELAPMERELPPYLRRTGNLSRIHILSDGDAVWRVRDDGRVFDSALKTEPAVSSPAPAQIVEEPVAPAPVSVTIRPPEDDGTTPHRCPLCPFADLSAQALVMHTSKLRDKAEGHPQTALYCPECPAVRNTVPSMVTHGRNKHAAAALCYSCAAQDKILFFADAAKYNEHIESEHADERRRRMRAPVDAEFMEEAVEAVVPQQPVEVLPEDLEPYDDWSAPVIHQPASSGRPKAPDRFPARPVVPVTPGREMERSETLSGTPVPAGVADDALQQAALEMIMSIPQLKAEVKSLRADNEALQRELEDETRARQAAEDKLDGIQKFLGR